MGEFELNLGVGWGVTEDVCGILQSSFIDMYMIGRTLKRTIYIYVTVGGGSLDLSSLRWVVATEFVFGGIYSVGR